MRQTRKSGNSKKTNRDNYVRQLVQRLVQKGKIGKPRKERRIEEDISEEKRERVGAIPSLRIIKQSLEKMSPTQRKEVLSLFLEAKTHKPKFLQKVSPEEALEVMDNLRHGKTRYEERYFKLYKELTEVNRMIATMDEPKAHKIARRLRQQYPDFVIRFIKRTKTKPVRKLPVYSKKKKKGKFVIKDYKLMVFDKGKDRPLTEEEEKRMRTLKTAKRTFYWLRGQKLKKPHYKIFIPSVKQKIPVLKNGRFVEEEFERPEIRKIKGQVKRIRFQRKKEIEKLERLDRKFDKLVAREMHVIQIQLRMLKNLVLKKTKFGPKQEQMFSSLRAKILPKIPTEEEKKSA